MINWDKGKAVTFLLESLGEFIFCLLTWLLSLKIRVQYFAAGDIRHIVF